MNILNFVSVAFLFLSLAVSFINGFNFLEFDDYYGSKCLNPYESLQTLIYYEHHCKIYHSALRLEQTDGQGHAVFANRLIKQGELLLQESYAMCVAKEHKNESDKKINKYLSEIYLPELNDYEREQFLALSDAFSTDGKNTLSGILMTNSFTGENDALCVYLKASRINHSCQPNVIYDIFEPDSTLYFHSLRIIEPNEQLYISYLETFQTRESRKQKLKTNYQFECNCPVCSANLSKPLIDKSDYNRELLKLAYKLPKMSTKSAVQFLNSLFRVAEEENVNDAYFLGELNQKIYEKLLEIENEAEELGYNITQVRSYALGNYSAIYSREFTELYIFS